MLASPPARYPNLCQRPRASHTLPGSPELPLLPWGAFAGEKNFFISWRTSTPVSSQLCPYCGHSGPHLASCPALQKGQGTNLGFKHCTLPKYNSSITDLKGITWCHRGGLWFHTRIMSSESPDLIAFWIQTVYNVFISRCNLTCQIHRRLTEFPLYLIPMY